MATTLLTKYGTGTRVRGAFNQWMRARAGVGSKRQNLASAKNIYNKYLSESKTAKHSMTQAFNVMAGLESPFKASKKALTDATSAQKEAKATYTSAKETYEPTVGPYTKAKEAFDLAKGTVTKAQTTYDTAYSAYETASTKSKKFQEAFTTAETEFNPLKEQADTLKTTGETAFKEYETSKAEYDTATTEVNKFREYDTKNRKGLKNYLMELDPPQGRSAIRMAEPPPPSGVDVYDKLKKATEEYRLVDFKLRTRQYQTDSNWKEGKNWLTKIKGGKKISDYGVMENIEWERSTGDIARSIVQSFKDFPDHIRPKFKQWMADYENWVGEYETASSNLSTARADFKKYTDSYAKLGKKTGELAETYQTSLGDYKKLTESDDFVTKGKSYHRAKYFHEESQKRFKSAKEAMEAAKTPYEEAITAYEATVNPYEEASKAYTPAKSAFEKAEEEYGASQDAYKDAYKAYQSANTQYQTASQGFSDAQNIYQRYVGNTGHLALAKGDVGTAQTALTGAISNMVRFQSGYAGERVRARAGRAGMRAKRTRRVSPLLGYVQEDYDRFITKMGSKTVRF